MALEPIAEEMWGALGSVRFVAQSVPARATVIRLGDGSLLVYSPVAASAELIDDAGRLGRVRHLVAPSKYHHLWLGDWARAFPEARTYGAPGLAAKRPDLRIDETLGDEAPAAWRGEIDQLVFRGLPMFNEVEFCHRRSRTLLVPDLVFNIQRAEGVLTPLVLRANGMWKRFGPSRLLRLAMRGRRRAAREDVERILAWDFERVVPAHGDVLPRGGREALRRAFRFLGVAQ